MSELVCTQGLAKFLYQHWIGGSDLSHLRFCLFWVCTTCISCCVLFFYNFKSILMFKYQINTKQWIFSMNATRKFHFCMRLTHTIQYLSYLSIRTTTKSNMVWKNTKTQKILVDFFHAIFSVLHTSLHTPNISCITSIMVLFYK